MFDDPKALTSANWQDIHNWLTLLWIYLPLIITFAFTILVAHAILPSLLATGDLPLDPSRSPFKVPFLATVEQVQMLRKLLTVFALFVLVVAVIVMVLAINQSLAIRNFWDRFLI